LSGYIYIGENMTKEDFTFMTNLGKDIDFCREIIKNGSCFLMDCNMCPLRGKYCNGAKLVQNAKAFVKLFENEKHLILNGKIIYEFDLYKEKK
jgi:hypothetical protein